MPDPNPVVQAPPGLLLLVPLLYAAAALLAGGAPAAAWRRAGLAAWAALALALAAGAILVAQGPATQSLLTLLPLGAAGDLTLAVRLDAPTAVMLALVAFLGAILLRYSRSYLGGDPGQARFLRAFLATLAAVTLLVIADNLLLLALAWTGASLALHRLLTFYPERPQALVAAHKKFLASRAGDACMLGAVALTGLHFGTLEISAIMTRIEPGAVPTGGLAAATLLFAVAAVLKCAQLPLHGWLIQVMEAPTPVSALLHAGIVNVGGFLMIRLAPLMAPAEAAQTVLVVVGTATAVVAALVATTRISIKVSLAWSTCAQMGFMLLQCGLGAYGLALLHLVAHSLYKAHAFLASGSTVAEWRRAWLAPPAAAPAGIGAWFGAALAAVAGVSAVAYAAGADPLQQPAPWALSLVVAMAATSLVVRGLPGGARRAAGLAIAALGVAALYLGWHQLFGRLVPAPVAPEAGLLRAGIVVAGFALLFGLQAVLSARPHGALARALHPHLFAGLYLDELATRATFRLWPARANDAASAPLATASAPLPLPRNRR